jgi:hypothetical protein
MRTPQFKIGDAVYAIENTACAENGQWRIAGPKVVYAIHAEENENGETKIGYRVHFPDKSSPREIKEHCLFVNKTEATDYANALNEQLQNANRWMKLGNYGFLAGNCGPGPFEGRVRHEQTPD